MVGRGADKGKAVLLDRGGKIGVLGEKADAGMDRVGAGDRRRRQDRLDIEIAGARRRRADADRLVGEPHIHCPRVGGRMHRDGLDPQLVAGAMNAQRDLAAIGDQHLLEHAQYLMASSVSPHPSSAAPQTPSPACGGRFGVGAWRASADHSISISGAPYSTGAASSIKMRVRRPVRGARIWFMTFIASMISSV